MRIACPRVTAALLGAALVSVDAHAQNATPSIALERFLPTPGPGRILAVPTARTLDLLNFSVGLTIDYAHQPLKIKDGAGLASRQLTGQLLLAFGLGWVEIGAAVPMSLYQSTEVTSTNLSAFAMGDVRVDGKVRFTPQDWRFAAGLLATVTFPSGSDRDFASDAPAFGFAPRVVADVKAGPVSLAGNVGYRYRSKPAIYSGLSPTFTTDSLYVQHEMLAGAGLEVAVIADRLSVFGEVWGSFGLAGNPNGAVDAGDGVKKEDKPGREEYPFEGLLGLKWDTAIGLHGAIGGGPGLTNGYGSPTFRVAMNLGYARIVRDNDRDGVPNHRDKCPTQKEDKDNFEDQDGCPDPDNDQDGILDAQDKCPNQAEDRDGFEDDDGCPDPDNDGDGIKDVNDRCPKQPEDRDGHEDEDGCPDPDNDGDGVPDEHDKCPHKAEDTDGHEDHDGCPDPDNDGDGIEDDADRCPKAPEDKDGFQDQDGCPDPDNDGDGLLDGVDKCPNEAEVYNGFQDEDGCPDKGKELVKLGSTQVEIKEKIFFETKSAVIKPKSFKLLNTLSVVINLHPELKKILIAGHSDERGDYGDNKQLSQERAESVMKFLVEKGLVDPKRLRAQGFGEEQPIVPNAKSAADHEKNRRVEFDIEERAPVFAPKP